MLGASKPFIDEILKIYGHKATDMLSGLVNNERFILSVQLLLERSLEFRELLQRSLTAAFEQMNIPTRQDTDAIKQTLLNLEDRLYALESAIERLELAAQGAPKKARGKSETP